MRQAISRLSPDVAAAVKHGRFVNGYHHWLAAGQAEGRIGGFKTCRLE